MAQTAGYRWLQEPRLDFVTPRATTRQGWRLISIQPVPARLVRVMSAASLAAADGEPIWSTRNTAAGGGPPPVPDAAPPDEPTPAPARGPRPPNPASGGV